MINDILRYDHIHFYAKEIADNGEAGKNYWIYTRDNKRLNTSLSTVKLERTVWEVLKLVHIAYDLGSGSEHDTDENCVEYAAGDFEPCIVNNGIMRS
jgi:hypothetical protein